MYKRVCMWIVGVYACVCV